MRNNDGSTAQKEDAKYAREQIDIHFDKYSDMHEDAKRILKLMRDRITWYYISGDPPIEPKSVRSSINNFRDTVRQMEEHGTNPPAVVTWSDKIRDFRESKVLSVWNREELEELILRLKFVETW